MTSRKQRWVTPGDAGRREVAPIGRRGSGMQRKHLLLASGVALLCTLAAGYTWVGLHSFAAYRTANANYAAPCGDIITWNPPSSIYTGLYPNQPGLVNVRYRSQTPQTLRLSV